MVAWLVEFSVIFFLKIILFVSLFQTYFFSIVFMLLQELLEDRVSVLFIFVFHTHSTVLTHGGPSTMLTIMKHALFVFGITWVLPFFFFDPIIVRCLDAPRFPTPDPTPCERFSLTPDVCISARGHCFVRGCSSLFFNTKLDILTSWSTFSFKFFQCVLMNDSELSITTMLAEIESHSKSWLKKQF